MIREKLIFKVESLFNPSDLPDLKFWLNPTTDQYINTGTGSTIGDNIDTLIDASGNGYDATQGTVSAQPNWDGDSAVFNGSTDFMNIFNSYSALSSSATFTFAFWINPDSLTPASNNTIFWYGRTSGTTFNRFSAFFTTTGKIRFLLTNDTGAGASNLIFYDTTSALTSGYHHIAIVQDGVQLKIYVDAVNQSLTDLGTTNAGASFPNIQTLTQGYLGAFSGSGGGTRNYFDGSIGVSVVDGQALIQSQIQQLYDFNKSLYQP